MRNIILIIILFLFSFCVFEPVSPNEAGLWIYDHDSLEWNFEVVFNNEEQDTIIKFYEYTPIDGIDLVLRNIRYETPLDSGYLYNAGALSYSIDKILDSNNHLKFSLIDSGGIVKSYDLDFDFIRNPYRIEGDSVFIKIPKGIYWLSVGIYFQETQLCQEVTQAHRPVVVGQDSIPYFNENGELNRYDFYDVYDYGVSYRVKDCSDSSEIENTYKGYMDTYYHIEEQREFKDLKLTTRNLLLDTTKEELGLEISRFETTMTLNYRIALYRASSLKSDRIYIDITSSPEIDIKAKAEELSLQESEDIVEEEPAFTEF